MKEVLLKFMNKFNVFVGLTEFLKPLAFFFLNFYNENLIIPL